MSTLDLSLVASRNILGRVSDVHFLVSHFISPPVHRNRSSVRSPVKRPLPVTYQSPHVSVNLSICRRSSDPPPAPRMPPEAPASPWQPRGVGWWLCLPEFRLPELRLPRVPTTRVPTTRAQTTPSFNYSSSFYPSSFYPELLLPELLLPLAPTTLSSDYPESFYPSYYYPEFRLP